MTNKAVIALTKKIESLFSQSASGEQKDQTFIAFTIPGLSMSPKELDFRDSNNEAGNTPQQALHAYAAFSRLVNNIPSISTNWSSDGSMLWDQYECILNQATFASNQATTEENKKLEQAQNIVKEKETAYKQYQLLYSLAAMRYNSLKLLSENTIDPNELNKLKNERDTVENDWLNKGYKHEVEEAYSIIEKLSIRSPMLFWRQLNQSFRDCKSSDIVTKQDFYETQFYPTNFYRSDGKNQWMRLVVDSRDIEQIIPEQTVNNPGVDITVSRLEVELTRVEIVRPWMNPSLFKSRFWQWPDNREPLSDGKQQPQGSLPAYATSIVFARNLKIETQSTSRGLDNLKDLGPLSLQNANVSGSNSIQSDGMQIIAFICKKLPKSPNPDLTLTWSGPIAVNWFDGQYNLDRNAKISQVKVTIRTGNVSGAGTDANVYFRVNNSDWWLLDKSWYNDFEKNDTDTYGPFNLENLKVENLSRAAIELKHDNSGVGAGWYVEWLRLEVYVEGQGWITYKEWQPGWLAADEGDQAVYRKLQ